VSITSFDDIGGPACLLEEPEKGCPRVISAKVREKYALYFPR